MKRPALAVAVLCLTLLPLSGANAFPLGSDAVALPPGIDQAGTVVIGTPFNWNGSTATGLNQYYWDPAGQGDVGPLTHTTCNKDPLFYCDQILVEFSNPLTQAEIDAGKKTKTKSATVTIDTFSPADGPVTDFDLFTYESDANGTLGAQIDSDGALENTTQEVNTVSIVTTPTQPSKFVLVRVVFFTVTNGTYKGHARF
jgi:hypothetical protein